MIKSIDKDKQLLRTRLMYSQIPTLQKRRNPIRQQACCFTIRFFAIDLMASHSCLYAQIVLLSICTPRKTKPKNPKTNPKTNKQTNKNSYKTHTHSHIHPPPLPPPPPTRTNTRSIICVAVSVICPLSDKTTKSLALSRAL